MDLILLKGYLNVGSEVMPFSIKELLDSKIQVASHPLFAM
jgi:hypothetical protein